MISRSIRRAAALLFSVAPLHSLLAQDTPPAPKRWTVDDVLAMKAVSGAAISPDGKRVAYVVTNSDRDANINKADIWIVSTDGGAPVRVTNGPRTDRAPQWAPDGTWIAFLSDRAERNKMQVWGIDPSGGEAWPITKHETSIQRFELSPNGQRIAFLAMAPASRAEQDQEKDRGRPVVRDSAYGNEWTRIWSGNLVNRAADNVKVGSQEGTDVTSLVWGPDSRVLAFGAKPTPTLHSGEMGAVYVQSEPGAEPRKVTRLPGGADAVGWPNDLGLIVSSSAKLYSTDNNKLWLVPLSGEDPVSLTDSLDESPTFVAGNARELWVEAYLKSGRGLFRIPLSGGRAAGRPQRVSDDAHYYSGFSPSRSGNMIAFLSEAATQAPDVHVSSLTAFAPKRLTTVNPQAASYAYGEQRVVSWRSKADSESIEGILSLPINYQQGTKVPLLLVIHGGPSGVSSNRYPPMRGAYPITVFNSLGYAVLQPNYRGSTAYGARFRGLNHGDILGKDWVDVNSGVDALIRLGLVDTTKMGIMGWSYGGFQTYWGITHATRYAAASSGAGANDLTSFYSQTDISEAFITLLGVPPWENLDLYAAHSAYRLVKNVTTPLLIQVGDADRRVPKEQSIQFYEAVKGLGKTPVKLVEYPGQQHGITDPRLLRDLMNRNVAWFSYWMPVTGNKPPVRVTN